MTNKLNKLKFSALIGPIILSTTIVPLQVSAETNQAYMNDSTNGWYGSVDGGATFAHRVKTKLDLGFTSVDATIKSNLGFNVGAAIGYKIDNFRIEAEIRYLHNKGNLNLPALGSNGDISTFNWNVIPIITNVYYDFNQISYGKIYPFIGAGIGTAIVSINGDHIEDDIAGVFAYQGMSGIAYDFNHNVSARLAYRYLGTSNVFEGQPGTYQSHSINLGLTYLFV